MSTASTSTALFTTEERARLARLALRPRRLPAGGAPGEWRTGRTGSGVLFADHRPYAPGDDPRYVDWNVYGRLGDLVVKRFESEENLDLLLCVDRSLSMSGRKAWLARRLAGALGHLALEHLDRVRLAWLPALPGEAVARGYGGAGGLATLLEHLSTAPEGGVTGHAKDLEALLRTRRRRTLVVVLSDFYDPGDPLAGLRLLRGHGHEVVALHVVDPAEVDLPPGVALRAVDAETGAHVDVDATPALLEALRTAWRRRGEALQHWCGSHGVTHVRADAARTLWDLLRELLSRGVVGRR